MSIDLRWLKKPTGTVFHYMSGEIEPELKKVLQFYDVESFDSNKGDYGEWIDVPEVEDE